MKFDNVSIARVRPPAAPPRIFPEFGNVGSAGVPTALSKARAAGRMEKGDLVVLAAIGSGINCMAAGVIW